MPKDKISKVSDYFDLLERAALKIRSWIGAALMTIRALNIGHNVSIVVENIKIDLNPKENILLQNINGVLLLNILQDPYGHKNIIIDFTKNYDEISRVFGLTMEKFGLDLYLYEVDENTKILREFMQK